MAATYKSYFLFNEVKNVTLQTFNRCATFFNIVQEHGTQEGQEYIKQFGEMDKARMHKMLSDIRDRGYNRVKQDVISSLTVH